MRKTYFCQTITLFNTYCFPYNLLVYISFVFLALCKLSSCLCAVWHSVESHLFEPNGFMKVNDVMSKISLHYTMHLWFRWYNRHKKVLSMENKYVMDWNLKCWLWVYLNVYYNMFLSLIRGSIRVFSISIWIWVCFFQSFLEALKYVKRLSLH